MNWIELVGLIVLAICVAGLGYHKVLDGETTGYLLSLLIGCIGVQKIAQLRKLGSPLDDQTPKG